jgi:hypothetical protein
MVHTGIGLYKTDPLSRTKGLAYSIIKNFFDLRHTLIIRNLIYFFNHYQNLIPSANHTLRTYYISF